MIIDAKDLVLGRFATIAAKAALNGEEVQIINCEQAIIVGKKENVFAKYKRKQDMGVPSKGPFLHRGADRIVRRTIRGMLPYKTERGKQAFHNVMCYVGVPFELEGKETKTFDEINIKNSSNLKFVTVKEVSVKMGFKY